MGGHTGTITTTRWLSAQLYSDGDGRIFCMTYDNLRYYLDGNEIRYRMRADRLLGGKCRVRVRAKSAPA